MSIDELFDGSSFSSPDRSPEKEIMAEILDILEISIKSNTIFIKRRELVKKELLQTIAKKTEKGNKLQVL